MLVRSIAMTIMAVVLWPAILSAGESLLPTCSMKPAYLGLRLPTAGLTWVPEEFFSGKCEDIPKKKWIQKPSGPLDLFVYPDGPGGSSRYWHVAVGVAERHQTKPEGGVCLSTSTNGWRTLLEYKRLPLPWLEDLDNDGKFELIIWSSFDVNEPESTWKPPGLVAWVYRLISKDSLVIDLGLSRQMARELAEAYRSTPQMPSDPDLRKAAAEALEQFADDRCSILQHKVR
jgi:hypothetical protein